MGSFPSAPPFYPLLFFKGKPQDFDPANQPSASFHGPYGGP